MFDIYQVISSLALLALAHCHVVITYPGWRGNNLFLNGSVESANGLGVGLSNSELTYPYGMQWIYPCGGLPITSNRTRWPVSGGAVALQPGWYQGHQHALLYINIGFGSTPQNYSVPLVPPFEIFGPSDNAYPGTVCLPQIPLPSGHDVKPGDYATIQVVEAAKHGAAMYSCVDITFVQDSNEANQVNETNCFNSTDIRFTASSASGDTTISTTSNFVASRTAVPSVTATNAAVIASPGVLGSSLLATILGML